MSAARLRIISLYNADEKRFFKQVLKGRRKGVLRREMNTFQSEGKLLRCPLQDKLFPSGSLGELFGGQSPTSWLPGAAGLHQSRAATAFCVGSFPPEQTDGFRDLILFLKKKGHFTASGQAFPLEHFLPRASSNEFTITLLTSRFP